MGHIGTLFSIIDFLGVFVGALGGALAAARDQRYSYDLVGVTGLALVSALGGGITRDIILQHGPPLAFQDIRYLVVAFAGAAVGLIFIARFSAGTSSTGTSNPGTSNLGTSRFVLWVDAAALGLFAVAGSTRALEFGMRRLPALLLGVITAVGGGSIRDVLSGRTPRIFERGQLHAIAAILGATVFLVCDGLGLERTWSTLLGTVSCFALRMLSIQFDWSTRPVAARMRPPE